MSQEESRQPEFGNTEPACQIRMASGRWQPITLEAVAHLGYAGKVQPDDEVRHKVDGRWEERPAWQIPNVPYRAMLAHYLRDVSRFLVSSGDCGRSAEAVMAEGRRIRRWADPTGAMVAGEVPASIAAQTQGGAARRDRATWFVIHIDFIEAALWDSTGAGHRAEPIYQWIASHHPDTVGGELWFAAKHQLACLYIVCGREIGLTTLCQLIELGTVKPHYRSGPTDYAFSEVLRYCLTHSRPHPVITRLLQQPNARAIGAQGPSGGSAADGEAWRAVYDACRRGFRERARETGLGKYSDLSVLWPEVPPMWDRGRVRAALEGTPPESLPISCGLLTALGAQDIEEDFGVSDPEAHARRLRLQSQLARARKLVEDDRLDEASGMFDQIYETVKDEETFASVAGEVADEREELRVRISARNVAGATRADQEFFLATDSIERAADLDQADARLIQLARDPRTGPWVRVLSSVRETLHRRRQAGRQWQLDVICREFEDLLGDDRFDDAGLTLAKMAEAGAKPEVLKELEALVQRRHAEKYFREGLDAIDEDPDKAEAAFVAAAQKDATYQPLAPPLALASRLFHEGIHGPVAPLANLKDYREELHRRAATLIGLAGRHREASSGIWGLLERFVRNAMTCGEVDESRISEIAKSISAGVKQYRSVTDAVERVVGLLDIIREHDPQVVEIRSAVAQTRVEVQVHQAIGKGERRRADNAIDEAADCFREAIRLAPESTEAWEKLIDCHVSGLDGPYSRKRRLVDRLCRAIREIGDADREQYWDRPEQWIESRLAAEKSAGADSTDSSKPPEGEGMER